MKLAFLQQQIGSQRIRQDRLFTQKQQRI